MRTRGAGLEAGIRWVLGLALVGGLVGGGGVPAAPVRQAPAFGAVAALALF